MNTREVLSLKFKCTEDDIKLAILKLFMKARRNQMDQLNYSFTEEELRRVLVEDSKIKETMFTLVK